MTSTELEKMLAIAPGFGACARCPYMSGGSARLCFTCAQRRIDPHVPEADRCAMCDQPFDAGSRRCGNTMCHRLYGPTTRRAEEFDVRWFVRNIALAPKSGPLETAVWNYKSGRRHWATIFGRILAGFLDHDPRLPTEIEYLIASPGYTGAGARRSWDHIADIVAVARKEQVTPYPDVDTADPEPLVIKTRETPSMRGSSGLADRMRIATEELRPALRVTDPAFVKGKTIAVFDDVFTDGQTLNEVARTLHLDGGATAVYGISLVRALWRSP